MILIYPNSINRKSSDKHNLPYLRLFVFLIGFNLPFSSTAQPVTPESEHNYIIDEINMPGGRLGNSVNAITQGPYGFMWFGTHAGLHRYDGYEFVTYAAVPGDTIGETTSLTFPYIEGLYWDSWDKLWVGTYGGGLYRFDPETEIFKHFPHDQKDSTSISHPRVLCAMEDSEGRLWIGTEIGLNLFDPETETFKRYYADGMPGSLHHDDARTLYVDKEGTLWIGAGRPFFVPDYGSLSRYDPDTDSFVNYIYDPDDPTSLWTPAVRGILEDSKGNFWVGTTAGLSRMDREKGTFERMRADQSEISAPGDGIRSSVPVYSILEDRKGGLWIGTIMEPTYPTHLVRFDLGNHSEQVLPSTFYSWQLLESDDGTIWVAGAGVGGKVMKIREKPKNYDLHTITIDRVWSEFMQSKVHGEYVKNTDYRNWDLQGPMSMALAPNGDIWQSFVINTGVNLDIPGVAILVKYSGKDASLSYYDMPELNTNRDVSDIANTWGARGMFVDKNGTIWGSYPSENIGIFNYDPVTGKTRQFLSNPDDENSLKSNGIVQILMDRGGDLWITFYDEGVDRFNIKTEKFTHYDFSNAGIPGTNFPISLFEARDGKIWIGGQLAERDGSSFIANINPGTNEIEKIYLPGMQSYNSINNISQSPVDQRIFFTIRGMGLGVYSSDKKKFEFLGVKEGFVNLGNRSIVFDDEGTLWIAGNAPGHFIRLSKDFKEYLFTESEGFRAVNRAAQKGPGGKVHFLTEGGIVEIDPKSFLVDDFNDSSLVELVDLYVLGKKQQPGVSGVLKTPIWLSDEILLPASSETFSLRFSDIDYQNVNPQFVYRLFPYEANWQRTINSPQANYYKVPSGNYTFQVKSLNRKGNNMTKIRELGVIILPPWYLSWWAYVIYFIIFTLGVFLVHTIQKARVIRKERERIKDRELAQAKEIEKAYEELKITQTQLIHSEKMASLGELTAGIAHEIQNPLNFVNNFSEVNKELIEELNEEIDKGNAAEAKAITKDLIDNEEKVVHHGKRAEQIVKSMLQHSRGSEGQKEATDINTLADEYLRLAYHGFRAKDKSFNADFKTELDEDLPKVNVVPQDIGRVLLNLVNNAFQAVKDVGKPTVTVSTRKKDGKIEISVKDNGHGIPEDIKEKIFQPFFTTKPTGEGTGLGLSLSYDIITKGHGGTIKVNSVEGEGTEFIILLAG